MDFGSQYNARSPAVKRLMKEAWEMREPTEDFSASPIDDNLFEWHFTIRGAADSDFDEGVYHGRITFPTEYPMKPPHILLFTPNGRFETNKKICLSISGHHPETWQPSWCVRTALLALIAFMPTPGNSTVGALDYTKEERQILARKSRSWECPNCGNILNLLTPVNKPDDSSSNDKTATCEANFEKPVRLTRVKSHLLCGSALSTSERESEITKSNSNLGISLPNVTENSSSELSDTSMVNPTMTRSHHYNLLENISSNFSNAKVTVSIIIVLIVLILYRRIFLLN